MQRVALPSLALVSVLATACWVSNDPPATVPGTCNNNGACELGLGEDWDSCPKDCPVCRAIQATGVDVTGAENATGNSDGVFAELKPNSSLDLFIGREIYDDAPDGAALADFMLVGEVTTDCSVIMSGTCAADAPTDGFKVEVSNTGSIWATVGYWTKTTDPPGSGSGALFDLGCGEIKPASYVRISSLGQAQAKLDALVATSCVE
jgi:hypothetical protein